MSDARFVATWLLILFCKPVFAGHTQDMGKPGHHNGLLCVSLSGVRSGLTASVQQVAEDPQALTWDATDGTLPAEVIGLRIETRHADEPPLSTAEPHLKPRQRAHPSRAPPVLA